LADVGSTARDVPSQHHYQPTDPAAQESVPQDGFLTPAETRVLTFLPTYRTLAAIGNQLGIGRPTVNTHVHNIYRKLGATSEPRR